jgi:hypothetical protein
MGMEETVQERLKEFGMIDVMENKILGPLLEQRFEQGISQGISQGLSQGVPEGMRKLLSNLLASRFGPLPVAVERRLCEAAPAELDVFAQRLLRASTIDEVFE